MKLDEALHLIEEVVSSLPGVPGMELEARLLEARLLETRDVFDAVVRQLRQGGR